MHNLDFELSPEQQLLAESADRFLRDQYGFEFRGAVVNSTTGFSREMWLKFAEMGWLGLPFAPANGGFGGTISDVAVLMEAFGKALVVEPYIASIVLAGRLGG